MHPNFLPPNLSVGKAWDFSPRIVRVESLELVWDKSANLASRNCTIHRLVEGHQDPNPTQKPGQVKDDWEGFAFGIQDSAISFQLLGPDWPLRCSDQGCRSNEDKVVY